MKVLSVGQEKEVVEIFQVFLKDDEDFVRLFLVDGLIQVANYLTGSKYKDVILGFFQSLAGDASWRIRYTLCDKIRDVGMILGKENTKTHVIAFYLKCLQDSEPEVNFGVFEFLIKICKFITILKIFASLRFLLFV